MSIATAKITQFDDGNVKLQPENSDASAETFFSKAIRPRAFEDSRLQAITSRRAGRLNAASVSDREVEELLNERRDLVAKMFEDSLTPTQERRLNYVRWSLDRIEDARHGEKLDELDLAVARYESLSEEIVYFAQQLQMHAPSRRRK